MAPPRWQPGWTDLQNPPPGAHVLNGASPVLARIGGVGPWVKTTFGALAPGDTTLVQNIGAAWTEGPPPAAGFILAQ